MKVSERSEVHGAPEEIPGMNRRTACGCFLAGFQTLLMATLVMATEQAMRMVQKIAGPQLNQVTQA